MRRQGVDEIKFETNTKLLKEEFSQGLILPSSKDSVTTKEKPINGSTQQQKPSTPFATTSTTQQTSASKQQATNGLKIETKTLKLVEEFKCRTNELYNCFTDINVSIFIPLSFSFSFKTFIITDGSYTQNPNVVYEAEKNGRFSLFDGNITGCFSSFVKYLIKKFYYLLFRKY
jgi:activator of HSP90 ATPase